MREKGGNLKSSSGYPFKISIPLASSDTHFIVEMEILDGPTNDQAERW